MLATTAIGAIWSSMGADFGALPRQMTGFVLRDPQARLACSTDSSRCAPFARVKFALLTSSLPLGAQISPKVLFTCNAVRYNGKVYPQESKLREVIAGLRRSGASTSSLFTVVIDYIPEGPQIAENPDENILSWETFLNEGTGAKEIDFWQGSFDAPLWVLFSSGTTGKVWSPSRFHHPMADDQLVQPKAIVHRAGGMLLQSRKEHVIHGGMTEDDVFFYFTTPAWMMMNCWCLSAHRQPLVLMSPPQTSFRVSRHLRRWFSSKDLLSSAHPFSGVCAHLSA